MTTADSTPFPCPFCQSTRVVLVGGGLVFLHYECSTCHEVWTAMAVTPKVKRPTGHDVTETQPSGAPVKTEKIWLN
jgi:transposase-like protein